MNRPFWYLVLSALDAAISSSMVVGLHAGLVQNAFAVVQHSHVVDHLDLIDLAVHGRGLDVGVGVVALGIPEDVV